MSTDARFFEEARTLFFEEAREMLQQMEAALLALEDDPDDGETLNALFRSAHTIKGSAGIFKLDDIVAFTHQVENVIGRVRKGELGIDSALGDVLLRCADVMRDLVKQAESGPAEPQHRAVLAEAAAAATRQLERYLGQGAAAGAATAAVTEAAGTPAETGIGSGIGTWQLSLRFGAETFRSGFDPVSIIQYLSTIGDLVSVVTVDDELPDFALLDPESCHLGFEVELRTAAPRAQIEAAFEFVGEDCAVRLVAPGAPAHAIRAGSPALPEARSLGHNPPDAQRVLGLLGEGGDAAPARQGKPREPRGEETSRFVRVPADRLDRLINLVGEMVIRSASASLQARQLRAPGLIDTTQQLAGLVEEIHGEALSLRMVEIGETELDKSVVDKIGDPLMHLVRNALDHGVELPAARLAAGKPAAATVKLSAHHDSGHVVIRVVDDGRGIDGDKLLATAKARGLVAADRSLSEQEKLHLIFAPGFSTAEVVTNLSGRGVGMDVVRKNIEALRGTVVLGSVVGVGTTIEVRLPLTLAIISGFLVRVGKCFFIIPMDVIVECIDAKAETMGVTGDSIGSMNLRGSILPYVALRHLFDVEGGASARRSVVVVRTGGARAGLVVDQLMGAYQTVIKPLGRLFGHLRAFSGSTVLGSGEVALILDVAEIVKLSTQRWQPGPGQALALATSSAARG